MPLESSFILKYKEGDLESFDLLIQSLGGLPFRSSHDPFLAWQMIPKLMNLFLVIDESLLSLKFINQNPEGPSILIRLALQKAAVRNFSYGKRGSLGATTFIASIIEAVDLYFEEAKGRSKKSAFRSFQKSVVVGFNLRKYLIKYDLSHDLENKPELSKLSKKMAQFKKNNEKIFAIGNISGFILKVKFSCGTKSTQKDQGNLDHLKVILEESKSMEEFLKKFLQP